MLTSLKSIFYLLKENFKVLAVCGGCFFLAILFVYVYYLQPGFSMGPAQPIPFSHRVHSGVKEIQCEFCHPYAARSGHPGLPPVEKCLYCHNHIIAGHPEIKKVHEFYDTKTPIAWVKANYLPEHVIFNHKRHIKKDVACEKCHGDIRAMDRIKGVEFKMEFCVTCHRENEANVDCWLACHN